VVHHWRVNACDGRRRHSHHLLWLLLLLLWLLLWWWLLVCKSVNGQRHTMLLVVLFGVNLQVLVVHWSLLLLVMLMNLQMMKILLWLLMVMLVVMLLHVLLLYLYCTVGRMLLVDLVTRVMDIGHWLLLDLLLLLLLVRVGWLVRRHDFRVELWWTSISSSCRVKCVSGMDSRLLLLLLRRMCRHHHGWRNDVSSKSLTRLFTVKSVAIGSVVVRVTHPG